MFSVIESVLLEPLDYSEPREIQAVYPTWPELVGHPTLGELALRYGIAGVITRIATTRTDPVTMVGVGFGLPLLAALAALPPARRATRVDPLEALEAE